MQKRDLIILMDNILNHFGFARKGNNWKIVGTEITKIVNLQKSSFGNQYYINYGFNLNSLDFAGTGIHIFRGLTTNDSFGMNLLDFDNALESNYRITQITQMLQGLLLKDLNQINTIDELKINLLRRSHLNDVPIKVKDFLGLPTN